MTMTLRSGKTVQENVFYRLLKKYCSDLSTLDKNDRWENYLINIKNLLDEGKELNDDQKTALEGMSLPFYMRRDKEHFLLQELGFYQD